MNKMKVPAGKGKQIYRYFEDYAKDQDLWIKDFIHVYEKMLQNGYENTDLIDGPNQFDGVFCQRRGPGKRHFLRISWLTFLAIEKLSVFVRIKIESNFQKHNGERLSIRFVN